MRSIIRAGIQGLIEIILIMPILLAISGYFLSQREMPLWIGTVWAVGFIGYALAPIINRLHVLIGVVLQFLISFSFFLFVFEQSFAGWVGGVIGCAAFFRGVIYSRDAWEERITTSYLWYGVLFYFFASFLFMFLDRHEPLLPVVYFFGSLNLIAALVAGNMIHLRMESGFSKGSKKVSRDVKRNNVVFMGLFLFAAFVLWITGAVRVLFIGVRDLLIGWLTNRASDLEWRDTTPPREPEPPIFDNVTESSDSSWLDALISILIYLAGGTITLFLLFLLLRSLLYLLLKLIASIIAYWNRRGKKSAGDDLGYEDEKNVLLELTAIKPKLRFWSRRVKIKWEQLKNNRERIRFLYTEFVTKAAKAGFTYRKSDTPSETIRKINQQHSIVDTKSSELLEREYNKARYGQADPADQSVRLLREQLKDSR